MSKISFSKPGAPASMVAGHSHPHATATATATATAHPQAPGNVIDVPTTPTAVAVVSHNPPPAPAPAPFSDDDDSFNPGDLVLPRLNIVQKVGDMSNLFTPGSLVMDGSLVIADAPKEMAIGPAIRFVVLGLQPTYFSEKIEGGGRGDTYKTEAEVVAAGGTLDWNEFKRSGKPLYQRVSTGLLLVEQPAGVDAGMFPHQIEGKNYALVLYTMKGVAYTNAARHFKSAKKIGHLREHGYRGAFWTFSAKLEKYGSNYAYRPVVKPAEATTETLRNTVLSTLGF